MQGMPVLFSIQEVSLLRCASFAFLYIVFCFNDCWAMILLYLQLFFSELLRMLGVSLDKRAKCAKQLNLASKSF